MLRTLLSRIHAFRLSCPPHMRRPTQTTNADGSLDVDLISAFMITHAASIALGEPLISSDSWTHDMARMCLAAIRAVLSLLYESECMLGGGRGSVAALICSHGYEL